MSTDRRSRKRMATRQSILDAATRLFLERGFEHVTVDEIAEAADVGRMTVFNHFPRKEDMFFDRDEEIRVLLRETLKHGGMAPLESLRLLAHRLVSDGSPFLRFWSGSQAFVETIEGSETLRSRARAMGVEIARVVTEGLAECVGRDAGDADAQLAAGLQVATWTVAFLQAQRIFRESGDSRSAQGTFLALVDQGAVGLKAALAGTPYV